MKKLNSTTYQYATKVSTYSQYKVIETNDGFFLNTVYHHDKETFEPTTKQSYNSTSTGTTQENNIILDRHISSTAAINCRGFMKDSCIPDLYNVNVYYIFSYNFLGKYEEKDGIITELAKVYYTDTAAMSYYLGQNEEYLFIANVSSTTKYIYKVLKSTLASTSMMTYYASNSYVYRPTLLKETTNYIYFFHLATASTSTSSSTNYSPQLRIARIDKTNSTCAEVSTLETVTVTSTSYLMSMVSDAVIKVSDTIYGIIIKYPNTTTSATDYFKFIQIDFTDEENPTVTGTAIPVTGFTATSGNSYVNTTNYYVFNNTINGTEYLYFIRNLYNSGTETNNGTARYFCMYTFKVTRNSSNVPTSLVQVDFKEYDDLIDSDINTFVVSQDNKIIVFWTKKGLYITKVDESTGIFVLMQTMAASNIRTFGIDKLNRIWIMYTDYSVGFVGLTDFSSYIVEFEKDSYAYTGEDINTYITLRCLDVLNNRMDASFTLTIVGNAIFDESQSKVLTVTTYTSDTSDLQVPITINGSGRIVVYPTLVVD